MNRINDDVFQDLIKKAEIICAPYYGYFVSNDHNEHPYRKEKCLLEDGSEIFCSESDEGYILIVKQNKTTMMSAFVLK